MKWKTDIDNEYNICILLHKVSWCVVTYTSNISCDRKHNVRLCCENIKFAKLAILSSERSTQQANCYTEHVVTNRIPITATHFRVYEDLRLRRVEIRRRYTSNGVAR